MKNTDDMQIIVRPQQFDTPKVMQVTQGKTIKQILDEMYNQSDVSLDQRDYALSVEVNGYAVTDMSYIPKINDVVVIYVYVGKNLNPIRMILTIALMVAAFMTGQWWVGAHAGTMWGAAIATAVVTTAGMLLVDMIAPIKAPSLALSARQDYTDSPNYALSGARNAEMPWGTVPINLGKNRVHPRYATKPYTMVVGGQDYLYLCFFWSQGHQRVSDMRIGEIPIEEYDGVQIEHREGLPSDDPITLIPSQVFTDGVGVDLKYNTQVVRPVRAGSDQFVVDVEFPRGLVEYDLQGDRKDATVDLTIQFREVGEAWQVIQTTTYVFRSGTKLPHPKTSGTYSIYIGDDNKLLVKAGTSTVADYYRIAQFNWTGTAFTSKQTFVHAEVEKLGIDFDGIDYQTMGVNLADGQMIYYPIPYIYVEHGAVLMSSSISTSVTGKTTSVVKRGYFSQDLDRTKRYEVGVTRVTADSGSNDRLVDMSVWTNLKSIVKDNPIQYPKDCAVTAVRIKGSDQLQGYVDTFNGLCESYVKIWDGVDWDTEAISNNPAALIRHTLMTGHARPRSEIHIDDMSDFYDFCQHHGYQYNMYHDFKTGVWDVCAGIAVTGRASPNIVNGKWAVTCDTGDQLAQGVISPRNSWGYTFEKILVYHPHAFRVRFKNELMNHDWDEMIVYADGYSASTATVFEQLEFPGTTSPTLVWRFARFHLAQAKLRPEKHSVYMDWEHMAFFQRGTRVKVAHDVPMWGGHQARIKSLTLNGGETHVTHVTLDDQVAMLADKTYGIEIRQLDDPSVFYSTVTDVGETAELELSVEIPIANAPAVGNLVFFGEADSISVDCLVHSIIMKNDLVAQVYFQEWAPEIYTADTGAIPVHTSKISRRIDVTKFQPRTPEIKRMWSGTSALSMYNGRIKSNIDVTITQPPGDIMVTEWRARYRLRWDNSGDDWMYTDWVSSTSLTIPDVMDKYTYTVEAQCKSVYGVASGWSDLMHHWIMGKQEPPVDVENFALNITGGEAHLSWDKVPDLDLREYVIRWSPDKVAPTWAESVEIQGGRISKDTTNVTLPLMIGTYLIKAEDMVDKQSENAATVDTAIARVKGFNHVEEIDLDNNNWVISESDIGSVVYNKDLHLKIGEAGNNLGIGNIQNIDFLTFDSNGPTIISATTGGNIRRAKYTLPTLSQNKNYMVEIPASSIVTPTGSPVYIYTALESDPSTPVGGLGRTQLTDGFMIHLQFSFQSTGEEEIFVIESADDLENWEFRLYYDIMLPTRTGIWYFFPGSDPSTGIGYDPIDLGKDFTCKVYGEVEIVGFNVVPSLYQVYDLYDLNNLYDSERREDSSAIIELVTRKQGEPLNFDWKPLVVGEYTLRWVSARVILKGMPPRITPIIKRVKLTIDMPDRTIMYNDTIPVNGKTVVFDPAFYNIPQVGVSVINGQSGDYITTANVAATGMDVEIFNSASASVERQVTIIAKGYGEVE